MSFGSQPSGVAAPAEDGCVVYGVVCSIVSCLFKYVAVDCVGSSVVVICL